MLAGVTQSTSALRHCWNSFEHTLIKQAGCLYCRETNRRSQLASYVGLCILTLCHTVAEIVVNVCLANLLYERSPSEFEELTVPATSVKHWNDNVPDPAFRISLKAWESLYCFINNFCLSQVWPWAPPNLLFSG